MLLAWRYQNRIAGLNVLFPLFIADSSLPFEHVDLVLPIVVVIGSEALRFKVEVAHQESGSPIFLVNEPLYPRAFRAFLGNGRILNEAHIDFMQLASQYSETFRKINGFVPS